MQQNLKLKKDNIAVSFKSTNLNKTKEFQDKDKIEQAASIVQNLLTNLEFVKFTKNTNLDKKKTGKEYDMEFIDKELLRKLDNKEDLSIKELNKLKKVYYQNEDYDIEKKLKEDKDMKKEGFSVNDIVHGIIMMRREP